MKIFNLFSVLVLATVFTFTSCKEKAADDANAAPATDASAMATTDPSTMPAADPNAMTAEGASATPVPTGPLTSLKFDNQEYDWGTVMDGDKVTKAD